MPRRFFFFFFLVNIVKISRYIKVYRDNNNNIIIVQSSAIIICGYIVGLFIVCI